jgi:hypothetical protein
MCVTLTSLPLLIIPPTLQMLSSRGPEGAPGAGPTAPNTAACCCCRLLVSRAP